VAYGHVVATSPQGDAYIVPLYTTIRQLKAFFETANVRLPEPLHLLSQIALHYVTTKQFGQAEEAIIALTHLVQDVCSSHQWERLAHWIRTSTARTSLLDIWDERLVQVFVSLPQPKSVEPHLTYSQPDSLENRGAKKWLTATYAFRERFLAENLSVHEYRFWPHHESFNDFASAVLPQLLEEINAPYNTASRMCRHTHDGVYVVSLLLVYNHGNGYSNSGFITTIICGLLSLLEDTSLNRYARRSELPRRLQFARYPIGLQYLTMTSPAFDIHTCLMVACSSANLQCTKSMQFNERLGYFEPLVKGGLASVYRAPSWPSDVNGKRMVAVKKMLKSTTTILRWLNEERILKKLQTFNDPHIVELLDSYCTLDSYVLVFPLANSNIDELMERDLSSSNIEPTAAWVVEQMAGLANALQYLHTGDDKNKSYGRHGDIKPENILWYSTGEKGPPFSGILKITDFGRSEFSSMSRRRLSIHKALSEGGPPYYLGHYAAPESEISTSDYSVRSSSSDIYSLGCVFLEMVVWLSMGSEARTQLLQSLRSDVPGRGMSFWHLDVTAHELSFILKPPIEEYLKRLLELTKDNATVRDTVYLLVYGGVLDPSPHKRPTAKKMGEQIIAYKTGNSQASAELIESPVWTRVWIYQCEFDSQSRHPWEQQDSSATLVCETLFLPPDRAHDEAPRGTEAQEDSEQFQDTDDESQLSGCDFDLDCGCGRVLGPKRQCPYCILEARPAALKAHVRAAHRNRQLYECPQCHELFGDVKHLTQHRRQLGPVCASASIFDGEDMFCREQRPLPQLTRTDSATCLRDQYILGDNSSGRSRTIETETLPQMRSGGAVSSHHHNDAGGSYVRY